MRLIGAFAAAIFACVTGPAMAAPPPASAYGNLPAIDSVAISPDGKHIAMLRAIGDDVIAEMFETATMNEIGAIKSPSDVRFRDLFFANNERVLIEGTAAMNAMGEFGVSDTYGKRVYARQFSVSLDGKNAVLMLGGVAAGFLNVNLATVWAAPADQPNAVQMAHYDGRDTDAALTYQLDKVDLLTGRYERVMRGTPETAHFILNAKGQVVGRVDENDDKSTWRLYSYIAGGWPKIAEGEEEFGGDPFSSTTLADGRFVMWERETIESSAGPASAAAEYGIVYAVDPASGAKSVLYQPNGYDLDSLMKDRRTFEIVGTSYTKDYPVQTFFDAKLKAAQEKVAALFSGGYAVFVDWDDAHEAFIVAGESGNEPPAYYIYHAGAGTIARISSMYPDIPANEAGERIALKYKARDGKPIPAYLTTPKGAERKNLPMIALVHGGPGSRDTYVFDYWASFLASRGYAVLQVNYRGSSGYGQTWERAGFGQWGKLMQDDVTDGVNAMIKAGIADPKRICIVGASYGGYAALAGATLTPDLYKCAVSVAGVSDPAGVIARAVERSGQKSSTADYWRTSIGDPSKNIGAIRAVAPLNLADQVKIPILLLHGTEDTVVPFTQSQRMADKLRGAGKSVTFVTLKGDDHWLSHAATRTQMLTEIDTFLAQNLK